MAELVSWTSCSPLLFFLFFFFYFGRSGRRLITPTASCRLHIHIGASARLFGFIPPPTHLRHADVQSHGAEIGSGLVGWGGSLGSGAGLDGCDRPVTSAL